MDTPTTSRRRLLQLGAAALPLAALGSALPTAARAVTGPSGATLRMPAETDPQARPRPVPPVL
ncbi:hypothetical protein AB0B13_14680 [Streptomyces sp. NPDC042898]|uniref:hypothetical protein n=1 Tax=Streptomyces sp. NPDC042898 TaxID=3154334 RepID=UPI0033F7E00A